MEFPSILRLLLILGLLCGCTEAAVSDLGPKPNQFKNLVTFGDSYTDIASPGDAGVAWPVYAAEYGDFGLFPFARSGATCSNNLTSRPFPSVFESQLPLYVTELQNGTLNLKPDETIYTLWIGTNDVGVAALLTGDQTAGVTIVDTVSCAVSWVKYLYETGARNFLFQNMIPLENTILYSNVTYPNRYWTYPHNATEWSLFMTELTTAGNALARLMLRDVASSLSGAHIGLFDSHSLFLDIIARPDKYLNGTVPLSVTTPINSCIFQVNESVTDPGNCTTAKGTDVDSYLWQVSQLYDELHPSEQTDRVIARELTNAVLRKSDDWVTWLS
ncbi:GDSL lipase/acylhydrolase [Phellopilus nigrolimitatus]|nr:GDSL lipase/acylhydrolase [Phellopilus nigrolimitatus]